MKFKVVLAILVLSGCLGRIYSILMEGKASASLSTRDSHGFIIDKIDVPDIATSEQKEEYLNLLDSTPKLKTAAPEELQDKSIGAGDELIQKDLPAQKSSPEFETFEATPPPIVPQVKVGVSPQADSALQKKLASLLSCKTRDATSRIPPVVWNHLLKKAGVSQYTVKGSETLPEVSEAIFGEAECWPKIWSQNPAIENPHDLSQNLQIVLQPDVVPSSRQPSSTP